MEPPKPAEKARVLAAVPTATAAEYEEYERLLSKRYTKDPSARHTPPVAPDPDEARLMELTKKLFGTS